MTFRALECRGRIFLTLLLTLALAACGDDSDGAEAVVDENPQLAAGHSAFQMCASCHILDEERHRAGPHLVGIFGREAGGASGFRYSAAMTESGIVWDNDSLDEFLAQPRGIIPGKRMAFAGLRDPQQRADLIEYLRATTKD
jgi:cytochrome c